MSRLWPLLTSSTAVILTKLPSFGLASLFPLFTPHYSQLGSQSDLVKVETRSCHASAQTSKGSIPLRQKPESSQVTWTPSNLQWHLLFHPQSFLSRYKKPYYSSDIPSMLLCVGFWIGCSLGRGIFFPQIFACLIPSPSASLHSSITFSMRLTLTSPFKFHLVPYIPSHLVLIHCSYSILMYNIPIYFYYPLSTSSHYIINPTMIRIFVCSVLYYIPNLRTTPGTINTCWKLNSQMGPYQVLITKVTENQVKWQ